MQSNQAVPPSLPNDVTFVDHLDYQLFTMGETISACRTERNAQRALLSREQQ
ncbi:hypothetical protein JMJ77_0013612, partial [Colletotrichum scovillei]